MYGETVSAEIFYTIDAIVIVAVVVFFALLHEGPDAAPPPPSSSAEPPVLHTVADGVAPRQQQGGFVPIGLILYGVAALAVIGALVGAYLYVDHHWETSAGITRGLETMKKNWDYAVAAQKEKESKQIVVAVKQLEIRQAKAKIVYKTITKEVEKVIERDREVYKHVCFEEEGLKLANAAIVGELPAK